MVIELQVERQIVLHAAAEVTEAAAIMITTEQIIHRPIPQREAVVQELEV
jgi:hypothetical protein